MPTYRFACSCGSVKEVFFKSLPSPEKQVRSVCEECGKAMGRDYANEGFAVNGGTNFSIAGEMGKQLTSAVVGGREAPVFRDNNGQVHEIRGVSDVARWTKDNQLGRPRMVEWRNPVTGAKSWVAKRTVMQADPVTGEVQDRGTVVRGSEPMVELGPVVIPSEDTAGRPMVNGVKRPIDPRTPVGPVDPTTGRRMTFGDLWKGGGVPQGYSGGEKAREKLA